MKLTLFISLFSFTNVFSNLLLFETQRDDFLKLHGEISKKVRQNEAFRKDHRALLREYKPYLDKFKKKDEIDYDFFGNRNVFDLRQRIKRIEALFNAFTTLVNISTEDKIKLSQATIDGFNNRTQQQIFEDSVTTFRGKTTSTKFFEEALRITDTTILEKYSKLELSLALYQNLTAIDTIALVLNSYRAVITNTPLIPEKVNYRKVLLSLNNIDNDIWKRDPEKHVKGETYLEIEKFLQGVVAYEKTLHPKGRCDHNCEDYENVTTIHNKPDPAQKKTIFFTYKTSELYKCKELANSLTACVDDPPRVYKYLKFNNMIYGRDDGSCKSNNLVTFTKKDGCSQCVCTMYYKGSSNRTISMRATFSDISKNKVIVGAKFISKNDIIHIQIKEGTLGPFLTIKNDAKWVDIENFKKTDYMIFLNQDIFQPGYYERKIHIADYKKSHANRLLTGVRFYKERDFLKLQIQLTLFDLPTGKLGNKQQSAWHDIMDSPEREIKIQNPDVPTRSTEKSKIVDGNNDRYVQFTHTSFESDFAQTTVPFFDAQEVTSSTPLQGLGIYYKRSGNSGGFLGIKLLTYDFRDYLKKIGDN